MKNGKKRNYLKLGILLFGISLLLWNCEQEEIPYERNNFNNIKLEINSFNKLITTNNKFKITFNKYKRDKKSMKDNYRITGKTVMEQQYNFTIDSSKIKEINIDNLTSYTFKIKRETNSTEYFENLVIQTDSSKNVVAYIIKYTPTTKTYIPEHNSYRFEGKREVQPITYNISLTSKIVYGCTAVYETRCNGGTNGNCNGSSYHIPSEQCKTSYKSCLALTETSQNCGFYDDGGGGNDDDGDNYYNLPDGGGGTDDDNDEEDNKVITALIIDEDDCSGGKTQNPATGHCECPEGMIEDSSGSCIKKCETTAIDLGNIFPNANLAVLKTLAAVINKYGIKFGIDTDEKLQHFLAQAGHETGGFSTLQVTENMNYSNAALIPIRYSKFTMDTINNPTKLYAGYYTNNPEALSNAAMCCKYYNGNIMSGDGWRFRGRGIFQLTWKSNYNDFNNFYNSQFSPSLDLTNNPNLVATNDTLAILSGLWFYKKKVLNKINIDQHTSVALVTRKVNGKKLIGLKDRESIFNEAKNHISCK